MNSFTNIGNDNATDAATGVENQAQVAKSYSQEEVDNMMARMKGSLEKKLLKPYAELGDPEELRQIKSEWEQKRTQDQISRGEFEKTLQEKATKWDAEIQKRDAIIKEYKINTPLVSAAAKHRAINADQVKTLLSNHVKLSSEGDVEVLDDKGAVRYNDNGNPFQVEDLVREFLDHNPHFVSATPATTHSRTNTQVPNTGDFDVTKLDLTNPADRKRYAEARKAGLIK